MKITLLGHASILAETAHSAVLMDPVFFDPYEHEMMQCHPPRTVHLEALPRPTAIILSHGHRDHLDPNTLRQLPRNTEVVAPRAAELMGELRALGFEKVTEVEAGQRLAFDDMEVLFTPSLEEEELGAVFIGAHGNVWNQVDTATSQSLSVQVLEALGGQLHVVLTPYNPLLEHATVWLTETEFPTERYHRLIEAALCSQARCVVPSSCGQSHVNRYGWLNHRVFPVTPQRFLDDLHHVAPEVQGLLVHPGQAVELTNGQPRVVTTPYATLHPEPWPDLSFDPPGHPPPPLVELPGDTPTMRKLVEGAILGLNRALPALLTHRLQGPLRTLWDRRATLQIDVRFATGRESWSLRRWYPRARFEPGVVDRPGGADYRFEYLAHEVAEVMSRGHVPPHATLRIHRRREHHPQDDFRLSTVEPARLAGEDPYFVVDETFAWNPLLMLL